MPESDVQVERGTVAKVVMNRPHVRNALNTAMIERLIRALDELHDAPEVRLVTLEGAGDQAFCAGADLSEVARASDVMARRAYFDGFARLIQRITTLRLPVIAKVQGYALAGGCGLAAACDFTLAAEDAVFGLPEVKLGLFPMVVMAPILRTVHRKAALELLLTGRSISGIRAAEVGLATRAVARDQLQSAVEELAGQLLRASPQALAMGKAALVNLDGQSFVQQLQYLREMVALTATTDDARDGIQAFFEKRPPRWQLPQQGG